MRNPIDKLSSTIENYLETIAFLKKEKKYARVGEIAKHLGVKSSTVNVALRFLSENKLVVHEKYGYVDLTAEGEKLAAEIQNKHDVLFYFLNEILFVDYNTAVQEACEIEHSVSSETIYRLERLCAYLTNHPLKSGQHDINKIKEYLLGGQLAQKSKKGKLPPAEQTKPSHKKPAGKTAAAAKKGKGKK